MLACGAQLGVLVCQVQSSVLEQGWKHIPLEHGLEDAGRGNADRNHGAFFSVMRAAICHRFCLCFEATPMSLVAYGCHFSMVEDLIELKNWGPVTESSRAFLRDIDKVMCYYLPGALAWSGIGMLYGQGLCGPGDLDG